MIASFAAERKLFLCHIWSPIYVNDSESIVVTYNLLIILIRWKNVKQTVFLQLY